VVSITRSRAAESAIWPEPLLTSPDKAERLYAERAAREQAKLREELRGKTLQQLRSMVYGERQRTTAPDNAAVRRTERRTPSARPEVPGQPVNSSGSVGHVNRRRTHGVRGLNAPTPPAGPVDRYRLVDGVRVPISTAESRASAAAKARREAARKAAYRANGWAHNGSTVTDAVIDAYVPSANHLPDHMRRELPRTNKDGQRDRAIRQQYGEPCPTCSAHHRGEC